MEYLGQHFLRDEGVLQQITDSLKIESGDVIVEIGPGHGELTRHLLEAGPKKIIAIERDKELAKDLEFRIQNLGLKNIRIIEGDALKEVKDQISKIKDTNQKSEIIKGLKIVGNIPYYITGYLLRILGELEHKPELIVLTIQKEVAERVCAKPPKMNLLAASVQFWATPSLEAVINKKAFSPSPEVDGAVIKLVPKTVDKKVVKRYYELIKIVFKQPRKTILNNLVSGTDLAKDRAVEKLIKVGISPNDRPQNLTVSKIKDLSDEFYVKK